MIFELKRSVSSIREFLHYSLHFFLKKKNWGINLMLTCRVLEAAVSRRTGQKSPKNLEVI